jgi:F-type H+-transporting ATPase subunit gamma
VANLKAIRKRISSVKATQKITRAMKMVAGARLNRAQQRITAMRPYAVTTGRVLREVVGQNVGAGEFQHPLLDAREEKRALYLIVTGDRGLCGSFNTSINKRGEQEWKRAVAEGREARFALIGRKGRDHFRRRGAPIHHVFEGVWDKLGPEIAREIARTIVKPFLTGEVDAVYIVYNEFKSAMSQNVTLERLFPLQLAAEPAAVETLSSEFIFEPDRKALLERLVPTYIEITVLRALYESIASQLGAQMTAMDAATKNASEMIGSLTLKYNRARQAAITTEILEIIGGAEALQQG